MPQTLHGTGNQSLPVLESGPPVLTKGQQEIDERLAKLEEARRQLQLEEYALLRLRNAAAPISTLPEECLSSIFIKAVEDEYHTLLGDSDGGLATLNRHRLQKVPTILVSVSSHWQDIALATPRMWAYLSVSLGTTRFRHDVAAERLKKRIERARAAPVSLDIDGYNLLSDYYGANSTGDISPRIELDVLAPALRRCQYLNIRLPSSSVVCSLVAQAILTDMPGLEDLTLTGNTASRIERMPIPARVTSLRSLRLQNIDLWYITPSSLSTVKVLVLKNSSLAMTEATPDLGEFIVEADDLNMPPTLRNKGIQLPLLQYATSLKDLTLSTTPVFTPVDQDLDVIVLHSISRLQLTIAGAIRSLLEDDSDNNPDSWSSERSAVELFRRTRMPGLRTLHITGNTLNTWRCGAILALLEEGQLPLETLHLSNVLYESTELLSLLHRVSHLTTLNMNYTRMTAEVIEGLTAHDTTGKVCCPKLSDIVITDIPRNSRNTPENRPLTMLTLLEMAKSRQISSLACAISSIVLDRCYLSVTKEVWDELVNYVDDLKINGQSRWSKSLDKTRTQLSWPPLLDYFNEDGRERYPSYESPDASADGYDDAYEYYDGGGGDQWIDSDYEGGWNSP